MSDEYSNAKTVGASALLTTVMQFVARAGLGWNLHLVAGVIALLFATGSVKQFWKRPVEWFGAGFLILGSGNGFTHIAAKYTNPVNEAEQVSQVITSKPPIVVWGSIDFAKAKTDKPKI